MDYNKNAPKGKFVNTTRGSTAQFPEISLDDLALEFFSSSSMNESDGGVVERNQREGRSVSRRGEIGRWARDTASSRRRERSVSRPRGDAVSSSFALGTKNAISSDANSRRRRSLSVVRSRGDAVSSGSAAGAKNTISSDAGLRRRRSLSLARYQISDSEVGLLSPFISKVKLNMSVKKTVTWLNVLAAISTADLRTFIWVRVRGYVY